jgi:hypothetical protein
MKINRVWNMGGVHILEESYVDGVSKSESGDWIAIIACPGNQNVADVYGETEIEAKENAEQLVAILTNPDHAEFINTERVIHIERRKND